MKFPADLVTFSEEFLNGKLHLLFSDGEVILILIIQNKLKLEDK